MARHGKVVSREELHAIMLRLPARSSRQFVDEDGLGNVPEPNAGEDSAIASLDRGRLADKVQRALTRVLERLGDEDGSIIRLRFCEKVSWADIARLLGLPAKPFYKRAHDLMAQLRTELEAQGVSQEHVAAIMGDPGTALEDILEGIVSRNTGGRPSVP